MKRTAIAEWNGDLSTGSGTITTQSGVLDHTQFSFKTRFADGAGSNPEELLGAAHAGCFTMAISYALSQLGFVPGALHTKATVNIDMSISQITQIELELTADQIDGLSEAEFIRQATLTKKNCLISKVLGDVPIALTISYP